MNKLIDLMDEKGLKSSKEIIDSVRDSDIDTLYDFICEAKKIINSNEIDGRNYTPYSYVASPETSGTGGCAERNCRLKRAEEFAYYSALYADKVYIELESINNPHFFNRASNRRPIKYRLTNDILIINKLLPLIDRGIVEIIKPQFNLCKSCAAKLMKPLNSYIDVNELENEYIEKAEVTVEINKNHSLGKYCYTINNLDELFEHGSIIFFRDAIDEEILEKLIKSVANIYHFTKDEIKKTHIIRDILEIESVELKHNLLKSRIFNLKYLTSKTFDSHILELSYNSEESLRDIQKRIPVYKLPIIAGKDLEKILLIRDNENEAFLQYRIALNKAAKERIKSGSQLELNEIYDDIIYPALTQLDRKVGQVMSGNLSKYFGGLAVIGGVVSVGVAKGLIPADTKGILSALGGTAALVKAGFSIIDTKRKNNEVKDNDFYFLWKLRK